MKHFLVFFILSTTTLNWVHGQVVLKNEDQLVRYEEIPQERIFVHINTSLFLTGEYLYYKMYCFKNKNTALSDMSKIGYVELISEKGEQLFKHKIKLENGLGNGDFFIPVTAQTGSYKLLAYTTWMKNEGIDQFFQSDIHIINPYQTSAISDQTVTTKPTDTLIGSAQVLERSNISNLTGGPLMLDLTNRVFDTRSKVSLTLKGIDEASLPAGNYSISVRKKGMLVEPLRNSIISNLKNLNERKSSYGESVKTQIYLPELRGELLKGTVSTSTNNVINDLNIAASIPGENFFIAIAKTDIDGNFYLNIKEDYEGDRIFLEILDKPEQDYNIVFNEQTSLNYERLTFKNLKLDSLMKAEILQRSIHNQIDNAYFKYKPDSIVTTNSAQLFDNKIKQTYNLDDFTRFKTVRETVFEIVKDVVIARVNKSTSVMRVQGYNYGTNSGMLPLLLIDGLQVTDHTTLLDHNAFTIEEINVFRDRFVIGSKVYQGALIFKTKNNDIEKFQNNASLSTFNLLRPEVRKNYFTQRYDLGKASRIPDDRLQLLWIPHLNISEKVTEFDFFTSDVSGEFEICIEGFTAQQDPVSIQHFFSVKGN